MMFCRPNFAFELLVQRDVFHLQVLAAQRVGNAHLQFVYLQTAFGDVVIGPTLHRLDGQFFRTIGRHQDADGRLREGFGPRDQFHAVLGREPEIGQQHIEMVLLQQLRRRLGVLGQVHVVTIFERRA